jgi:C_GCAxxG_C_C family probable redox protein
MTDLEKETEQRVEKGREFFMRGYNCSQSVALAFADVYDVPEVLMARISASFGGGIGRMRETCGTALGIFMLAGLEVASEEPNQQVKAYNYKVVQELAEAFRNETGSLICRELLQMRKVAVSTEPVPDARTAEYYKKRPCVKMVETAIRIYCKKLHEMRCQNEAEGSVAK